MARRRLLRTLLNLGVAFDRRGGSPDPRQAAQPCRMLVNEFAAIFSEDTINRNCSESVDLLGNARINVLVPVLAHRFARERLRALCPRTTTC